MVWTHYLPKKSLVGGGGGEWQTKFNVSPGSGLWTIVLGPSGPDLGPDLDLPKKSLVGGEWQTRT